MRTAWFAVGAVFLGLAVCIDLVSLVLWLRLYKRGSGPSGIPVVSWLIYFVVCQARQSLFDLLWLTLFHASCQYLVPFFYFRLLLPRDRKEPPSP